MGSKSSLLRGELGDTLLKEASGANRFVDLFSGAGSVGHFIAENLPVPVLSVDLQEYSRALAGSITERTHPLPVQEMGASWIDVVRDSLAGDVLFDSLKEPIHRLGKATVLRARKKSSEMPQTAFISRHYGGHYFSPQQAYVLDRLFGSLPKDPLERSTALAVLIHTASVSAASPGHTAQPFQPTTRLIPHIRKSWSKDVLAECHKQLEVLGARHALVKGTALVSDALTVCDDLGPDDLVFCDPPYSAAQYSRFYHVLEGIARGGWPEVSGAGRSPAHGLRSSSDFSMRSKATTAMEALLSKLHEKSCRVVITFPDAEASNGLSGKDIVRIAASDWTVHERHVASTHSTLGGSSSNGGRGGRRKLQESVLIMTPKAPFHARRASLVGDLAPWKDPATSDIEARIVLAG